MLKTLIMCLLVAVSPLWAVDLDSDGMDDLWENQQGLSDPALDADGDGQTNLEEYFFGTNPNEASNFMCASISLDGDNHRHVTWPSTLHKRYRLQYSNDLNNFYNYSSIKEGTGLMLTVEDTGSVSYLDKRFYRVKNEPANDKDGDGIDDWLEVNVYGTDYESGADWLMDDDGDRIPNIYEEVKGTDKNDPNSAPAADFFVDPVMGANSTTDNIYSTIQEAINQAPDADTTADPHRIISVKPGVYEENITIGFDRKVAILAESSPFETVINFAGNDNAMDLRGSGCVLDGFVLSRFGATSANYSTMQVNLYDGCKASKIINCIFRKGSGSYGGGIYLVKGHLIGEHLTITDNEASVQGRALYVGVSSTLDLTNSIIWGNKGNAPSHLYKAHSTSVVNLTNVFVEGGEEGGQANDPGINPLGYLSASGSARNTGVLLMSAQKDIHGEARDGQSDAGADEFSSLDGDNLPDAWEIVHFGNLGQGDLDDNDTDGLNQLGEYLAGTDPNDDDTDDDQYLDGAEIAHAGGATDPLDPDTDDDDMLDGLEAQYGLDPHDHRDSHDDADCDRYPNVWEIHHGSNPTDETDIPDWNSPVASAPKHLRVELDGTADYTEIDTAVNSLGTSDLEYVIIEVGEGAYGGERIALASNVPQILLMARGRGDLTKVFNSGASEASYSGIFIQQNAVISNLTIESNYNTYGGGIYYGGSVSKARLNACLIRHNSSSTYGAGLYVYLATGGELICNQCTVFGNEYTGTNGGSGMRVQQGDVTINNSIFWNPSDTNSEISINGSLGSVTANHSVIRNLSSEGVIDGGGSIEDDPLLDENGFMTIASVPILKDQGLVAVNQSCLDIHGELRDASGGGTDIGVDEWIDSSADTLPDYLMSDPNYDFDGDGLSLTQESLLGTLAYNADTNGDLLSDYQSFVLGLSATSNDIDGDGLDFLTETMQGTSPYLADSDGDGVNDNLDAYPCDSTRSTSTGGTAGSPPTIQLLQPHNAIAL